MFSKSILASRLPLKRIHNAAGAGFFTLVIQNLRPAVCFFTTKAASLRIESHRPQGNP